MDDEGEAIYVVDMQDQTVGGGDVIVMEPLITSSSSGHAKDEEQKSPEVHVVKSLIEEKLDKVRSWSSDYTIYRVPNTLVNEKPEAYIPHMISIGPFHHDQQHLHHTEARKIRYFQKFLNRESGAVLLSDYIKAVKYWEELAYLCYPDVKIDQRDSFFMMMVVDGCFILELLFWDDENHDTVSDAKWSYLVSQDLIMLENQLPIFVLEALYKVFKGDSSQEQYASQLYALICKYFVPRILRMLVGKEDAVNYSSPDHIQSLCSVDRPKHLLDFVRQFLIPSHHHHYHCPVDKPKHYSSVPSAACGHSWLCGLCLEDDPLEKEEDIGVVHIRCVKELEKASVKFEKNKNPTSLSDIKFDMKKGVLTIPGIIIDHGTELILRNLVAYEQYIDDHSYITEYAAFMDGLIDSSEDVELLQDNGIIVTMLGDPSEVARLFNNLLKDVTVPICDTITVRRKLEQYYNIRCHKWMSSLMRNYFNTPWSFISVVAAVILLVLTVAQTIYAVLAYHY
ncbi:UPF0481 protein At3g47200-like [Telopea speciosissima]|uniref:UPF0481 protein At3g47200-like n=1 Tax=Telopea speciosissima TaxID=54955 RepID=UPI001CC7A57B|nr:UPF0481 protein At3g47200-like [Telopea speciosissima]